MFCSYCGSEVFLWNKNYIPYSNERKIIDCFLQKLLKGKTDKIIQEHKNIKKLRDAFPKFIVSCGEFSKHEFLPIDNIISLKSDNVPAQCSIFAV